MPLPSVRVWTPERWGVCEPCEARREACSLREANCRPSGVFLSVSFGAPTRGFTVHHAVHSVEVGQQLKNPTFNSVSDLGARLQIACLFKFKAPKPKARIGAVRRLRCLKVGAIARSGIRRWYLRLHVHLFFMTLMCSFFHRFFPLRSHRAWLPQPTTMQRRLLPRPSKPSRLKVQGRRRLLQVLHL